MSPWTVTHSPGEWTLLPPRSWNLPSRVGVRTRIARDPDPWADHPPARLHQVHGDRCIAVEQGGHAGQGDALVTRTPGVVLAVATADCLPVILLDGAGAVAIAHAGWRGLVGGILESTWDGLAPVGTVTAILGPAIGLCCFEVGKEVAHRFPDECVQRRRPRPHVDLARAAIRRLQDLGVSRILGGGPCTRCHQHFLNSYRGSGGGGGRMWTYVEAPESRDS